jgi:hypothetical protein
MKTLRIDAWFYHVGMALSALVVAASALAAIAFVALWAIELI